MHGKTIENKTEPICVEHIEAIFFFHEFIDLTVCLIYFQFYSLLLTRATIEPWQTDTTNGFQ